MKRIYWMLSVEHRGKTELKDADIDGTVRKSTRILKIGNKII